MTSSYYDVVVIGADVAPLSCGALLAKRGFRVLVVGQGTNAGRYRLGTHHVPHRPFAFHAQGAPIVQRVLGELGLAQAVRRWSQPLDPAFQLAMPRHRVDVRRDGQAFERELDREFPTTRRPILDFHERAIDLATASDRLFASDDAWPPDGLWHRRRSTRLAADLPFEREGAGPDLLAELPDEHPMRLALGAMAALAADGGDARPPALAFARLYASACRDPYGFDRGRAGLSELLVEKIRAHSGAVNADDRVEAVAPRRTGPLDVALAGGGQVAAGFVVSGVDVAALMPLFADRAPFEELFDRQGEPQVRAYRYTLNVVVRRGGLPDALAHDLYRVVDATASVAADEVCHIQRLSLDDRDELACIEALLPGRRVETEHDYLDGVRERLLAVLEDIAPFVRERIVCVDSPHDGRTPDAAERDAAALDAAERRGPATMTVDHVFPVTSHFGTSAMPVRTPIRHLLLCNRQVLPSLGLEGQLLAAAAAARVVSRTDRRREWMRRGLWNRVRL